MASGVTNYVEPHSGFEVRSGGEANSSGVAWGAVIGGAFVAAAFYLILLALGAGFGLSAISPWTNSGASASTVGIAAIAWLILIEVIASALGGYITGRLRTKWALVHTDEVFFRDTANGLLSWAVALVVSVTLLTSAATAMVGRTVQAASTAVNATGSNAYFVDTLFRSDRTGSSPRDAAIDAEAGRILTNSVRQKELSVDDQNYLTQLTAARTGLSVPEAQKRVSDVETNLRQTEDEARTTTARILLWFFVSLLAGAFSACYFATIGGRLRDHVKAV